MGLLLKTLCFAFRVPAVEQDLDRTVGTSSRLRSGRKRK
jgi:hypothetical protein